MTSEPSPERPHCEEVRGGLQFSGVTGLRLLRTFLAQVINKLDNPKACHGVAPWLAGHLPNRACRSLDKALTFRESPWGPKQSSTPWRRQRGERERESLIDGDNGLHGAYALHYPPPHQSGVPWSARVGESSPAHNPERKKERVTSRSVLDGRWLLQVLRSLP